MADYEEQVNTIAYIINAQYQVKKIFHQMKLEFISKINDLLLRV